MSIFRKSFKNDKKKPELLFHKAIYGYTLANCNGFTPHFLRMRIHYGENISKKRIINLGGYYCKISIYRSIRSETIVGDIFETKVHVTKGDPIWYEEMLLRVDYELNRIVIDVHDKFCMKDTLIGTVTIHLQDMNLDTENSQKEIPLYRLNMLSRGSNSHAKGSLILYLALLPKDYDEELTNVATLNMTCEAVRDLMGCPEIHRKIIPASTIFGEDSILPEGWVKRVDQIGRIYYANFKKKMTQWEKPTLVLDDGWEKKYDRKGRAFYINHLTKTTQWEHPKSGAVLHRPEPTKTEKKPPDRPEVFELPPTPQTDELFDTDLVDENVHANLMSIRTSLRMPPSLQDFQIRSRDSYVSEFPESHFRQRMHIEEVDNIESGIEIADFSQRREEVRDDNVEENNVPSQSGTEYLDDLDKEPLPPGWETAVSQSGRRFFINHKLQITTWADPRKRNKISSIIPENSLFGEIQNEYMIDELGPLDPEWEEKVMPNGSVFYVNHQTKITQWEDPRIGKLHKNTPKFIPDTAFKQKYEYFRRKLVPFKDPKAKLEIKVNRSNLFFDAQQAITMVRKIEYFKAKLWIEFIGEKGLDFGGVSREFFYLLSREMFDPSNGYFQYASGQNYSLQINPDSGKNNPNHLAGFRTIGTIMGMAIFHGKLMDAYFIRPFYKMMMCKKISITDMEIADPEYYNSLRYIINNNPESLDLTFSVDDHQNGVAKEIDLIPNGRNIYVTESNKKTYIASIIRWRFVTRIEEQMLAFMDGFTQLIPIENLQIFSASELELLISGLQDINVNDWKKHTIYKGGYNRTNPVITNFWKVVYSFNLSMRSRLLQFSTGTSRVPMHGFAQLHGSNGPQRFCIEKWGATSQFPRAHTCFNRIDLPPYESYDVLRQKLIVAILHSEGFEGVD